MNNLVRCNWANKSKIEQEYHDNVWGQVVKEDLELFKRLSLECMQAGLSWVTILNKYDDLCIAFDNFDPNIMKDYDESKINSLLNNKKIIRHKLKILSMITNSISYFKIVDDHNSFSDFLWSYVDFKTINNKITKDVFYTQSDISLQISKDLKKYGFKFVGPTIVYAFMQSVGMVNDHEETCFKK